MSRQIFLHKCARAFCQGRLQPFHIGTIAVNRLYGTAQLIRNILNDYLFHPLPARDIESGFYYHFPGDFLFWHFPSCTYSCKIIQIRCFMQIWFTIYNYFI